MVQKLLHYILGALLLETPKVDFSIILQPLKLQITEKVLKPMKFRSKALVLTYPKPFGVKVGVQQTVVVISFNSLQKVGRC